MRRDLYQELLIVSEELLQHCREANWEQDEAQKQLLEIIDRRQKIIDQIAELNQAPLTDDEQEIIKQILILDQESARLTEAAKVGFVQKINKVQKGKRTTKAYSPDTVQTEGYFIDQKK
ncbi:MAG: flagellar protein FliT [Candidatus Wallacebacter cryptica]|jgi:hypothetical protein|nr:flagellar protein FliT [Bacillota bacterium]